MALEPRSDSESAKAALFLDSNVHPLIQPQYFDSCLRLAGCYETLVQMLAYTTSTSLASDLLEKVLTLFFLVTRLVMFKVTLDKAKAKVTLIVFLQQNPGRVLEKSLKTTFKRERTTKDFI